MPLYPLPDLVQTQSDGSEETSVAYVIGTTFTFWDKLIEHLRSATSKTKDPLEDGTGQGTTWNPIDEYCQDAIEQILLASPFSNIRSGVRFSWYPPSLPDKYVHIQSAAHVSGELDNEVNRTNLDSIRRILLR